MFILVHALVSVIKSCNNKSAYTNIRFNIEDRNLKQNEVIRLDRCKFFKTIFKGCFFKFNGNNDDEGQLILT